MLFNHISNIIVDNIIDVVGNFFVSNVVDVVDKMDITEPKRFFFFFCFLKCYGIDKFISLLYLIYDSGGEKCVKMQLSLIICI